MTSVKAQKDLKSVSPDFQKLFESSPALYLVLDIDAPIFTIRAVSQAYLAATLTQRDSIIGKGIFEIFPDNPNEPSSGVANLKASLLRVLETKKPDTMAVQKYDIRTPDGSFEERFWSPLNTPLNDENGNPFMIIHKVDDVTEFIKLKRQEQAHLEVNEQLQQKTAQMESEIYLRAQEIQDTNKKLREAVSELEHREKKITNLYQKLHELDKIKTQFFSNVSHELRTPLSLILGPVRKILSENSALSSEQKEDLNVVDRNAKSLLKQVNDLLDIAKLEDAKFQPHFSQTDIAELVRLTSSNFDSLAKEKKINFLISAPEQIAAEIDTDMIQKSVLNLIVNAFKFTPTGGSIKVSITQDKDSFELVVADNGNGVPDHLKKMIFQRFRQGDGSGSRKFGGTGLGLAIAKEFVELHRGSLSVKDTVGGGATFVLSCPLKAPVGSTVAAPQKITTQDFYDTTNLAVTALKTVQKRAVITTPKKSLGQVLVVEDNPELNQFLTEILSKDFHVESAFDGKDGLNRALTLRPDLILTDMMMPHMTGEQMLREIRTHHELDNTPIILLTAKSDDKIRLELLKNGAQDYLIKPFFPEEILVRVRNLVSIKRTHDLLKVQVDSQSRDLTMLAQEIVQKNQVLEQASAMKDEFLSLASHELKTPLTSLKLQLDLLDMRIKPEKNQTMPPEDIKHALHRCLKQTDSLAKLVEDLLDISKIHLGRMKYVPENLSLSSLIYEVTDRFSEIISNAGISLELNLDDRIMGHWDRLRLEQVFTNLLMNIVKYASNKPAQIKTFVKDEKAHIIVRDAGMGIPKEKQELIFEQFGRATSLNISGLGLGLYIVKHILEAHEGTIAVESEVRKGAEFTLILPLQPTVFASHTNEPVNIQMPETMKEVSYAKLDGQAAHDRRRLG